MMDAAKRRAQQFQALADPVRLRILDRIRSGSPSATEINQFLGMSQPRVAHHLKILVTSGLVNAIRDGRFVRYRPADQGFEGSLFDLACESFGGETVAGRSAASPRVPPAMREKVASPPAPGRSAGTPRNLETPADPEAEPPRKGGDIEDYLL